MDWQDQIDGYKKEQRIAQILATASFPAYQPDMSISDELKQLLAFTSRTSKDRVINGPEDLATAQQLLNEINQYRDRAVEVHLSCMRYKTEVDLLCSMVRRILLLKPEVEKKTVALQNAIVGSVSADLEAIQARWETLLEQSKFLWQNCRSAYDNISTQIEVAKQIWYQNYGTIEGAAPGMSLRNKNLSRDMNQR